MRKSVLWLRRIAAAAVLAIALMLALQCVGIHAAGAFSREIVAQRLRSIAPVLLVCMIIVLTAAVFAGKQRHEWVKMSPENRLRLARARAGEIPEAAAKEEKLRRRVCTVSAGAVAVCAAGSLKWLLDRDNFVSWDVEKVLGQMLRHAGPWVAAAFAVMIAASCVCGRSAGREAAALRGLIRRERVRSGSEERRFSTAGVRIALYIAAGAFIVLGVMNGGLYDVLVKAINICTECIGLG